MRFESVLDAIGHTPLVRLNVPAAPEVAVYAKLELQNLFAMKDRVARQVVLSARAEGVLAEGAPIVESSSGTMALGLALVGTHLGHPVHIVTDPRIDPITMAKLQTLGCVVHIVDAMSEAGWQSARLERLARLMDDLDGAFWPRQYHNPENPLAYRALADELRTELPALHGLVGAVGSGGSLCGTAAALLPALPSLAVIGVDAVGSMLFGQPDRPQRLQGGLGNSLQPGNIDYSLLDEVHWLSDDEAFAATGALAREQQIFGGNTSGSVYRVLTHTATRMPPGSCLVGIFPDRGDRYVDSVYRHVPATTPRRAPVQVDYGTAVTAWSYARLGRVARPQLGFVESNTTGTGMRALRVAARLGVQPVLFTGAPQRYQQLDESRARVVVCDTDNEQDLSRSVKAELQFPAGITTTSDFYLPHVAALAESAGLPGNPRRAIEVCRNKVLCRQALGAAGIRQPRYAVIRQRSDIADGLRGLRFPCVVKPADDSGSNNVLLCRDEEEATRHIEHVLLATENVRGQRMLGWAVAEEYVAGPEVSVEMFSHDGRTTCLGITAKTTLAEPHFVEGRHVFPADLPDELSAEIVGTVQAALVAVGITHGATHTEIRLGADGPAIVEINARPAGGMIPDLIFLATGIDIVEQHLRAACGLPLDLAPTRARYAGITFLTAQRAGTLVGLDGLAAAARVPGVDRAVAIARPGARVRPPRNAYDRLGYIIAAGETADVVGSALEAASASVRIEVHP
ncbi:pyridoxal-phosphate dependent enzyme [Micromonospora echinofusca]|uniref:Pyridoxal-phosphate dependent enzyme n=1 Tax=Micromonospora echinofusca TaxID=47858 RepID=A0ABS3VIR8_MICEH|nr:pyridoxal-phosphate dependent enzyme [Micromonospora echinofusca]MBO4204420.1 pyridoxal-phosphate dependent enzyme [Micromonospora echinofusca]